MQIVTPRFFIFLWSLGTIVSGCLRWWSLNTVSVFVLMLIPDFRSFKGWQKNAITAYLGELSIKIGKPNDFI
ncbi:hypothetical protein Goari_020421 [Gossypium aridum]|uniref:Uncharacterized protein n=1 Tax=Gossypium aridum TaxID=34290 RepID=A0A7J8YSY1_GOSAI|nr:hypothetical protein [Gossypium aridum]